MAIIKLTKSKKAVQIIDDEGNVFGTSVVAINNMLGGTIKGGFVLLSRMPYKVSSDRFKKSPLYTPPGYIPPKEEESTSNDSFSVKNQKANKDRKTFIDREVL